MTMHLQTEPTSVAAARLAAPGRVRRWRAGAHVTVACAAALFLSGCVVSDAFSGAKPVTAEPVYVELPNNPARLGQRPIEMRVKDALELTEQKRFDEARRLLKEIRATQPAGSEGWKAATAAMAITALRAGDMAEFHRVAGELDQRLGNVYRVDQGWVEVITLHRALKGGRLPVNAPPRLLDYLRDLGPAPAMDGGTS